MDLYRKKEECCGCGACADICPTRAIRMHRDREGFAYPFVDGSLCVRCGRCESVCPIKHPFEGTYQNQYMGAQAKSEEIRYGSSSGGVFPLLAASILRQGGVVYGAGYNDSMEVTHQEADDQAQLEALKKTKYVQSDTQGVFLQVERRLKEGRWVLFCGTPCQARALWLFLGKEYEKLLLVDLVCYGAPSPGLWSDYVAYLEKKHHGKLMDFSFRDKRARDCGHSYAYMIDGVEYAGSLYQDPFCRMYFANDTLRPSCYHCKFCTSDRSSDVTLGDFWGIEKVRADMEDGMGTSMLILHTDKAKKVWEQVKEDTCWFACEREDLLQPRLRVPTKRAKGRALCMFLYSMLPFSVFLGLGNVVVDLWKLCKKLFR